MLLELTPTISFSAKRLKEKYILVKMCIYTNKSGNLLPTTKAGLHIILFIKIMSFKSLWSHTILYNNVIYDTIV